MNNDQVLFLSVVAFFVSACYAGWAHSFVYLEEWLNKHKWASLILTAASFIWLVCHITIGLGE